MPQIPSDLLAALTARDGSRLAIVIGAGCSIEQPTYIPLARELSAEAHRKLVQEGVIAQAECEDPTDLAKLATVIFKKTGSQAALVRNLPVDKMRTAPANEGYRILIALMLERVVSHALSLNFDLAPQNAAVALGVTVTVIDRPNTPIPMMQTVVYLHGSVTSAFDDWILRSEVINQAWIESWQEVVARQVLAAPNVLFVGLGSAAPVLSETVKMISTAIGQQRTFYQADIGDHEHNYFAQQLAISADRYVQHSWCSVMSMLGSHLAKEQVHTLIESGEDLFRANGATATEVQAFKTIANSLRETSLLTLGKFRANARPDLRTNYVPRSQHDEELMATPLKSLALISIEAGLSASLMPNGIWHLKKDGQSRVNVLIVSGQGTRKLSALEPLIQRVVREIEELGGKVPDIVLVGSAVHEPPLGESSAPADILKGPGSDIDIVEGRRTPRLIDVDNSLDIRETVEWINAV